ncbi:hypothetical protein MUK42_25962 [Musa troglodytarum]|uniref:Uncharacterized protein n=1 Tax=Musa troglodytarum TaxID=320322 RepID=A0A9E7ICI1_9LILI|nr:hypothetical protein MUK42_25962 [Musa troglodytarum]
MKSRVGSHCLVFVNRERSSEVIMHEMLIPEADLHLRIKDLYAVGPLSLLFCFTAGQFQNPCQVRNRKP